MRAAAESRGVEAARATCAHCGLAVPRALVRDGADHQFCCGACRQVYTLVREWGFDQYYRLLDQQQAAREPAKVTGRNFEDFDDPRQQGEATDAIGPGHLRTRLYLEGVHCSACVWLVEKLPAVLAGVDQVRLNYGTAVADVTWRPSQTRLSTIGRALDRLGYTPHIHRASRVQDARRIEDRAALARVGVAAACAMNLMFLHGALYAGAATGIASAYEAFFRWMSFVVALPVLLFSARPFFRTALAGLRARVVHIDLPIAIALAVAFAASAWNTVRGAGPLWFDSLAMLVAALLGARQLQRSAQRAALERADSLRGVAFLEFARRLDDGDTAVEVPLAALSAGDRVEVRSGELVPVDGIVLSGRSSLDNAVLTGESTPIAVAAGDAVNAGSTNLGARLIVRVEAAGEQTRVGALLAVVEQALARKPALLQTTDRLARRFVWTVLIASAITGIAWLRAGAPVALERVVALLVVSCPCALGLSVPLALSIALLRAARTGIFVKNPDALERLCRVDTVLLDKTGTLTEGRPGIARWDGDDAALDLARALESESSHSVARAFQATDRPLRVVRAIDRVVETPGLGISGCVDGHEVCVGNLEHVQGRTEVPRHNESNEHLQSDAEVSRHNESNEHLRGDAELRREHESASTEAPRLCGAGLPSGCRAAAAEMVRDGLSPVYVAIDGEVRGVAGIGDALRRDAAPTVVALRSRGIRVRILSGDHPDVARRIGAPLGLVGDDVMGGLTPEGKRQIVESLVGTARGRGAVVMVGDGVNDAAALAIADVGIAVHGGMGATIVAADLVLTRDGIVPLLAVLRGVHRLRAIVRRNVGFSVVYNVAVSALAIAGLVGPLLAVVLMPLSSLTVLLSSAATPTFVQERG